MPKDKPRLDAMLSSTSLDLPEHRKQADDASSRAGYFVIKMEDLGAKYGKDAISVSMAMVEEAEVYIGIFGLRYGYCPKDTRNPKNISVTEMEYRLAKDLGMPILIFIMHEDHPAPDTSGLNAQAAKKISDAFYERSKSGIKKLERFKNELKNKHLVAFFKTAEDLRTLVLHAMDDPDLKAAAIAYHERRKAEAPKETSEPVKKNPAALKLYAFPSYSDQNAPFVGRKKELRQLDQWSEPDGKKAMLVIDAIGGMGKSALAWNWIQDRAIYFDGVFWYSFYEGGADIRECIRHALAYVSQQDPDDLKGRELPKMLTELEAVLKEKRYLLVLDGLERVLLAYHRWDAAQMQDDTVPEERNHRACTDPQDADVLKRLVACLPSRILLTSRLLPTALEDGGTILAGVEHLPLMGLSPEDARRFWKDKGIQWHDEGRLDAFIGQFGRHSLLLKLIGGQILKRKRSFEDWYAIYGEDIINDKEIAAKRSRILAASYRDLSDEAKKVLSQIAALDGAVELDTLNVFNPYLPPRPQVVEKPHYTWVSDYKEKLAAHEAYLKALEAYPSPKSHEHRRAVAKFDALLQELEERGLLWWDKAGQQYDLHPVVRGYAFEQLEESERPNTFDYIYNYFDAQERDFSAERVQSLRDLQNTLAMYNALIGAKKFEAARQLFSNRLKDVLIFGGLGLYRKAYELLLPFFPDGLSELPALSKPAEQGYVRAWMGAVLYLMDRNQEALQVEGLRLKLAVEAKDSSGLGAALGNYALSLDAENQLAQSLRVCEYKYALAILRNEGDEIAKANYYLLFTCNHLGRWREADAAYEAFRAAPITQQGFHIAVERTYSESLLYRGESSQIIWDAISEAERLNEKVNDPLEKRVLKQLKGEVLRQMGNISEAEGLFQEAIRLGNEAGLNYGLAWGGLARAYLQAGHEQEALRIINEESTTRYSAAFVYWKTGQIDLAKDKTLNYYNWAWAQGEPYVYRYHLERARELLKEMGVEEPKLPVWDESKYVPFDHEEEVKAFIEELKQRKEEEARQEEEEEKRKKEAGEEMEDDEDEADES